ncbi:MAG: hypothetical protein AMXMBFR4_05330 [Candidatus Hydrogenedentota bacterium]
MKATASILIVIAVIGGFLGLQYIAAAERDPNRLWCGEHGLYEDECLICHPELAQKASDETSEKGELWCNEHGVAEKECGVCQPQLLNGLPVGKGLKVRFPSETSIEKAGIRLGTPTFAAGPAAPILGEVTYNRNEFANVTPLGAGVIAEVLVDVGERVAAGQVLATVNSPVIAEAKSAYLKALAVVELARQVHAREKDLHARKISARQDYETAQATLATAQSDVEYARQHLKNLGLSDEEAAEVAKSGSSDSVLRVRAPFAGTVVQRDAVRGTAIEPGIALFSIADLSTMWMRLSIPETRLQGVEVGAPVQARFDAYPGLVFEGTLSWVGPSVDEHTRMVEARAVLTNTGGMLKHGMFGQATLSGFAQTAGITVPIGAVQDVDGRPVVFTRIEDDLFETRLVEVGPAREGYVAILAGLTPADRIATDGSYILKSEFLKARLGAGCTDH